MDWKLVTGGAVVAGTALYGLLARARPGAGIPATMKRLVLAEPNAAMNRVQLQIEEVPVPVPKSGEVRGR